MALGSVAGPRQDRFGAPQIDATPPAVQILRAAQIVDYGRVVFQGNLDLNPALDRIRRGEKLRYRNDGTVFRNREARLPRRGDREYYREFVFPHRSAPFPGPARIVLGKAGEVFFTGDHYVSFVQARPR